MADKQNVEVNYPLQLTFNQQQDLQLHSFS